MRKSHGRWTTSQQTGSVVNDHAERDTSHDTEQGHVGKSYVGLSGWSYPHWRGGFYPKGLKSGDELRYVASRMPTVELNGSFYSLQRPARWRAWRDATPDDFVIAVKGSRYITHVRKLRDVETPLANFFAQGVLQFLVPPTESRLGPILWQLPPTLVYNAELIGQFLDQLPQTAGDAFAIARRHDAKLGVDRVWLGEDAPSRQIDDVSAVARDESTGHRDTSGRPMGLPRVAKDVLGELKSPNVGMQDETATAMDKPLRYALEPRHESFADPQFAEQLRVRNIALVRSDGAGHWPEFNEVTADFAYARLHGSPQLYASGYTPEQLDDWADWAQQLMDRGHDVYAYFDNDSQGHAPFDALALAAQLRPLTPDSTLG